MEYVNLAKLIRRFDSIELLATEIESIEGMEEQPMTIDELSDFLFAELQYSN